MTDRVRLDATVHGRVQGVGFRWFVQRAAARLGLVGWTANLPDGSVHVVAEGMPEDLDEMVRQLERGPSGAMVDRVDAATLAATGEFGAFEIRSRAHRGD